MRAGPHAAFSKNRMPQTRQPMQYATNAYAVEATTRVRRRAYQSHSRQTTPTERPVECHSKLLSQTADRTKTSMYLPVCNVQSCTDPFLSTQRSLAVPAVEETLLAHSSSSSISISRRVPRARRRRRRVFATCSHYAHEVARFPRPHTHLADRPAAARIHGGRPSNNQVFECMCPG
jgi:hypothetical protein